MRRDRRPLFVVAYKLVSLAYFDLCRWSDRFSRRLEDDGRLEEILFSAKYRVAVDTSAKLHYVWALHEIHRDGDTAPADQALFRASHSHKKTDMD